MIQHNPSRAPVLALRTGCDDNGLLGALQPVDLLFKLGDPPARALADSERLSASVRFVTGRPSRQQARQRRTKPLVDDLRLWLEAQLAAVSGKSTIAGAIRYALSRWEGLTRFLDDGRIEIDSNVVERSIRPIALGRKNHLFAGSDGGGEQWAVIASLVETCKMNAVDPQAYLHDVLSSRAIPWVGSTSCCRSPMCRRQRRLRPENTAYDRFATSI